ncbi:oxygen-insensitive NADPH nitroreductase, partial [Sphaerochaeta sp. S2]|uniref:oxygen-insensitive NADPH nitroreductase n=1 Tax=Sphaerochaeta sp. S2 TaxID=2798868 RepID=UPI0018EA2C0C
MNKTIELIGNHVSIREYTDEKIKEETLKYILEKAQYASTSSFLQAYTVIRVNNESMRKKISELSGEQAYIEKASDFLVFCADLKRLSDASERHGKEAKKGYTEMFIISTVDTALYAQNVMLAAESLGIGGVFIGGIRNNPDKICQLLNIPDEIYPVFGMCLGYPAQKVGSKLRLPIDVVVKEEIYSEDNIESMLQYDEKIRTYYQE